MSLIRIEQSSDRHAVDYDNARGMYRVSKFDIDGNLQQSYWFSAYEEKEVGAKDIAMPVKRFSGYNHEWWAGYCPKCNSALQYNYQNGNYKGQRQHYCFKCGQLCDFEDEE